MSNSKLVDIKVPAHSNNYTVGRSGRKIKKIAIHHMAGVLTAKQCGKIFQNGKRKASSHYGIGNDGKIALYVDEKNTAYTNSNWNSNCESVTIETSNSKVGGNYPVSDVVLNKLIKLVADIAKRNNLGKLVKGENVVWHRMYAKTNCPGDYLMSKLDYIIEEANKINSTPTKKFKSYKVKITANLLNVRDDAGKKYKVNTIIKKGEIYTITNKKGSWGKLKSGAGWIALKYTKKV